MKSRLLGIAGLVALLGMTAAAARAEKPSGPRSAGDKIRDVLPPSQPVFTHEERVFVKDWFRSHHSGLPPGLARRDRLPPGLEKHLRERGTLPPGLQKKLHPLPFALERHLRRLPTGYRRVVIAGNVVLMNRKTAVIYDIIRDVIP